MDELRLDLEPVTVSIPGGASYDPAASILDDARAAARRPWPYTVRPKEFLIVLGRHRHVPAAELAAAADLPVQGDQLCLWKSAAALPSKQPEVAPEMGLLGYGGDDENVLSLDDNHGVVNGDNVAHHPPSTGMGPPNDKRTRKKYYALRAQARKVRTSHPRQARALDAHADALMEPVLSEAPSRARTSSSHLSEHRTQDVVAAHDIDRRWLDLQVYQITKWARGTPQQRQRAAALLDMLLPVFAAAHVPPPTIADATAPIDLSAYRAVRPLHKDIHEYGTSADPHLDRAA